MFGVGIYGLYLAANWFIDQMAAGIYVGYQVMCQ